MADYGTYTRQAYDSALSVRDELSPGPRAVLDAGTSFMAAIAGGDTIGAAVASVGTTMARDLAVTVASEVGGELAQVVPVVGQIVALVVDAITFQAQGGGRSADECVRLAGDWYRPFRNSGPNKTLMPPDFFMSVSGDWTSAKFRKSGTELLKSGEWGFTTFGQALWCITETEIAPVPVTNTILVSQVLQPIGLPPERRAVYEKLRLGIMAARGEHDSDGGWALWNIYLDMLHRDFLFSRMTPTVAAGLCWAEGIGDPRARVSSDGHYNLGVSKQKSRWETLWPYYLMAATWAAQGKMDLATGLRDDMAEEGCLFMPQAMWDPRGYEAVNALVEDYDLTVNDMYGNASE